MHACRSTLEDPTNRLEQSVQSAPTRRSAGLASELVDVFFERAAFTHPRTELELFAPALDRVAVDECLQALRELWSEDFGRRIFVTGNLELEDSSRRIAAAYAASRAVAVTPPDKIEEAVFAYTDFGPPGRVAQRRTIEDLGITLLEFENGVRLNLKPTDFEAGRIQVGVRVGGGQLSQPEGSTGLAFFASNTFSLGGLGRHSYDELQRVLAGRTRGDSFGIGNDAFTFSGTTNRDDLLIQLQLLCARLTDPGFRPEAMRQFEKYVGVFYTRLGNTVQGPLQTEAPRLLANGDPRFGIPPRETVTGYTLADARAWLVSEFERAPVEIAIVGDFEPDAALEAVAHTYGTLPRRASKPPYEAERQVSFPASAISREYFVPTEIPKGIVQLFWPATDGRDVKLARRLSLLASVFEDKLRVKLREEMGDTYSPNAGTSLSDTYSGYGFVVASAIVEPAHARTVAGAIREAAAALHRDGVTEDEMMRAKQPALTAIRQSARTNGYWLGSVLAMAQEQPERIEWARTRLSDIEGITAQELTALARQYLDADPIHEFISLPATKPSEQPAESARVH